MRKTRKELEYRVFELEGQQAGDAAVIAGLLDSHTKLRGREAELLLKITSLENDLFLANQRVEDVLARRFGRAMVLKDGRWELR